MTSHTPGPWRADNRWIFGAGGAPLPVASGYHDYATAPGGMYYAEACANARLIAAAPDLLAVLQRYMAAYPAFRIKPEGAPGSPKRIEQERLMALEDMARELATSISAEVPGV